ncbi:MAG: FAD-dependent oxidoreductase [Candidatus Liptonbacteria bacterium]
MYDLVIIGGGPGGVAAGVYAARKKMKTVLVTESFGGQSLVSADIQNWIGTKSISGFDLARALEEHLKAQEGIEVIEGDLAVSVSEITDGLLVKTKNGKTLETKYLLLASGSKRRRLGVPGEDRLDGKGVAYCSICDAPLFDGKNVAVIGGGNAGLEAVIDLLPYATKIYLLERNTALRGDQVTQDKIKTNPKVQVITMAETVEILGESSVSGLRYKDISDGSGAADGASGGGGIKGLPVQGVFVEIGAIPNASIVKSLVNVNAIGEVIVDPKNEKASHSRIWAVGDVTDVIYKQNNISVGDAVKAVLNIHETCVKK